MIERKPDNSFKLYIPLTLDKAGDTDNGWKVKGLASTEDVDMQGEIVKQNGLDISPVKQGRGWINYNHSNDPEDMVGKLDDADLTTKGLFVEGYLFKKHKKAQNIYSIMNSLEDKDKHSLKLSIEGQILKRTGKNNKVIASAKVDKVAITFDPINTNTYVELCKAITTKNKEWSMDTAPDKDLTQENIMSEGDQKQENHPSNAAGSTLQEKLAAMDAGGKLPDLQATSDIQNKTFSGPEKAEHKDDVHQLLSEIKDMLASLVVSHNEVAKSQIKTELSNMIRGSIINKLGRK